MSKLNLKYYNYNDLIVYNFLKTLDNETSNILKTKDNDKIKNPFIKNLVNPQRKNVLDWYDFDKNADLLEVNSGLGVLAENMCDKVKSVTVLDFSPINVEIIKERLSEKENLEIFISDLSNIKFNKKFDYIILNDILEYSKFFFEIDSFNSFINYFKKLLKSQGKLIFILSNKFGIKSFAGMPSEHTLQAYDEIQGYKNEKFMTSLSQIEIKNLMNNIGFKFVDCYYPIPNFSIPNQILTDDSLNYLNSMLYKYDDFTYSAAFDTKNIMNNISKSEEFPYFANSFVIIASNKENKEQMYYSKFYNNCLTRYFKDKKGNKFIKTEKISNPVLKNIKLLKYEKKDSYYVSDYIKGKTLYETAKDYIQNNDEKAFFDLLSEYIDIINNAYSEKTEMDFIPKHFSITYKNVKLKSLVCVRDGVSDMDVNTITKNKKEYTLLEYNNIFKDYVPVNYLIFAGLYPLHEIKYNIDMIKYFKNIGITDKEIEIYTDMYLKINSI